MGREIIAKNRAPGRALKQALRLPTHPPHLVSVLTDPHADLRDRVVRSVLQGAGESDPAIRRAAAEGSGVPADLQGLIDKIHRHAYRVTDADIVPLQTRYGDDQMFEIVVSAALGASRKRLLAGLEALDDA
jgi:hypothetical protein